MNPIDKILRIEEVSPETLEAPSLLQSGFWCRFKEQFGWKPHAFKIFITTSEGETSFPLFVLVRTLLPGFALGYITFGPVFPPENARPRGQEGSFPWNRLIAVSEDLREKLPKTCRLLRFDLPWEVHAGLEPAPSPPFEKAPLDIQPPDTVVLDLSPPQEDILAAMKPKTRYNIRLSMRKGVKVTQGTIENLADWYRLYLVTAKRDRIAIHSFKYYETLFELSSSYQGTSPIIKIFLSYAEGTLVGGIIVALFNRQAVYLYGASSDEYRNYMASYSLQWQAMLWAKNLGAIQYDLFGIPPQDDPNHPMSGLYRFKTGFGGRILHRLGCWDYPLHRGFYRVFRIAEKARKWYYKVCRKLL